MQNIKKTISNFANNDCDIIHIIIATAWILFYTKFWKQRLKTHQNVLAQLGSFFFTTTIRKKVENTQT